MSILVDQDTRVIVQGITGRTGTFHTTQCVAYGTNVVAGVTPGKGGTEHLGVPVFDTVRRAVLECRADTSVIFVPPAFAADSILEAADAGIALIIVITEGIPAKDMVIVKRALSRGGVRFVGPNCPGVITPGECKIGIMPGHIHQKGNIGVVSRSGTLTYEVVGALTARGMGQSTCLGIGGDPVIGTTFVDALRLFQDDPDTRAVAMVGEIGGSDEEEAAAFIRREMDKPVAAFIAGKTAPKGKRMGHAGAIVSGGSGTAAGKVRALEEAGIKVADNPDEIADILAGML